MTRPLRSLINTIGLVVAIVTSLVVPSGFLLYGYLNASDRLAFKAHLSAIRIAQYIYTHDHLWQYHQIRLFEQIQLVTVDEEIIQQKIYTNDDKLVLEDGPPLAAPVITRRATIIVSGTTRGYIDVAASFRDTLYWAMLVAVLSSLLGSTIYFALRTLPLRVLDRTLGALNDAQRRLLVQNERFDLALTNMSQGLCMFDADGKLIIFNSRFAEIYGLSLDEIKPGMTMRELMALAFRGGKSPDVDLEGTLALQRNCVREGKAGSLVEHLKDARSISIVYRPTPDGGLVATFEDITERLLAEEKIKHLAHYDALTDLPNRTTFYERMESVLLHLRRRSESIAVLSLDLDRFKSVNDTLGHPVGDLLLRAAAERMRSCVRAEDIAARLGGDEFAIVQVPSEPPSNITALATRLLDVIGAPYDLDGHQVVVGVSIGIATAPSDGDEPDVLMKNADLALYRAKADGGGVYRFFKIEMDARMQARRALELALRKGMVNGEFEVFYQPIIDVKSAQIITCEALLRWHHPERGMVSPLEFIPVAEETGLIIPLGEWTLRQACCEAARWPNHVTVAVNVSPTQFKGRSLLPTVINTLTTSGLSASRLELEITETVLLQDNDSAFAVMHQLRDLGIKIAMDDFGTGYSSLGYLRSFPFAKIKIDQSFIRDLPGGEDSVAIVRAVVAMSNSLGIRTTAEGVETKAQLASVTSEGCDEFQGFLFSQPRSAAEIGQIIAEQAGRVGAVA